MRIEIPIVHGTKPDASHDLGLGLIRTWLGLSEDADLAGDLLREETLAARLGACPPPRPPCNQVRSLAERRDLIDAVVQRMKAHPLPVPAAGVRRDDLHERR